jgi:hypothetical protein
MKKITLALSVLLLAGCKTTDTGLATPVQIPPLPANLAQKAGPLPANDDITMGGQVKDNTNNIIEYNSVSTQLNKVIELYDCVREAVNNKKEIKCL